MLKDAVADLGEKMIAFGVVFALLVPFGLMDACKEIRKEHAEKAENARLKDDPTVLCGKALFKGWEESGFISGLATKTLNEDGSYTVVHDLMKGFDVASTGVCIVQGKSVTITRPYS